MIDQSAHSADTQILDISVKCLSMKELKDGTLKGFAQCSVEMFHKYQFETAAGRGVTQDLQRCCTGKYPSVSSPQVFLNREMMQKNNNGDNQPAGIGRIFPDTFKGNDKWWPDFGHKMTK